MRQTRIFLQPLFLAFLIVQGSVPTYSAHALRDLSLAESAPKKAGMEDALGLPDEDALLEAATANWQAQVKQGQKVNWDAFWAAFGSKPSEQAERVEALNALHGIQGDVFVVPDKLLNGRSAFQGDLGLWVGEEAARQAGVTKLLAALQTGDFSAIPAVKEPAKEAAASPASASGTPAGTASSSGAGQSGAGTLPGTKKTKIPRETVPEKLTLAKLKDQLQRGVTELLRRRGILPNSVLHNQVTGWVVVDTSQFTSPGFFFIRVPLGDFYLRVLLPDSGLHGLPPHYAAELSSEAAILRVKKLNSAFAELYRQHSSLSRLSRFFPHPKHFGENLLRRSSAVLEQGKSGDLVKEEEAGLALVRKGARRILRISALIERVHVRAEGKEKSPSVSGAIIQEALALLLPELADWPYLQAYVRLYRDGILPDRQVDYEELKSHLLILGLALMEAVHIEMAESSELLQKVYHRLYREALREEVLRLQRELEQVTDPQVPEGLAAEITTATTMVLAEEIEEELYRMALEEARRGRSAPPDEISVRLNAAGVLLMNEAGEPEQFIPGAGTVAETRWLVGHLQVHPLKGWAGGLPAVALVVPSFSRMPNPDQIEWFLSDAALVHRLLGRPVEVYLAAADEKGSVTLYRPSFSTADPESWATAMVAVTREDPFERFSSGLADRLATSSKESRKMMATREMAKEAERSRVITLIQQLAKEMRSVVRQEIGKVGDDHFTAWVMEAVETALGKELTALAGTQFGKPHTKEWATKIWDTDHAMGELFTVLSAAAGEPMAFSLMSKMFEPVSLPWTAPAPSFLSGPPAADSAPAAPSPAGASSGSPERGQQKISELVQRAVEKGLIQPDQQQALSDFIEKVWFPSGPKTVNYPRLEEAWRAYLVELESRRKQEELDAAAALAAAQTAEQERLRLEAEQKAKEEQRLAGEATRQRDERAQAVLSLVKRLQSLNAGNSDKVIAILKESGILLSQMDPALESGSRAQLVAARNNLAVRFGQGPVSSAEQAIANGQQRPNSKSLEGLSRAVERIEEALKVVGDLEPAREKLQKALENARAVRQAIEARLQADAQKAADDLQRQAEEATRTQRRSADEALTKERQRLLDEENRKKREQAKERAEEERKRKGEPKPVQKAAMAILQNASYQPFLSDPKVLSGRAVALLRALASTGFADLNKVSKLLRAPAQARLDSKQANVLGNAAQVGLYNALIELADLTQEASEETQAGAEEINEILDAAGTPASQLPARQQGQLDRDL